MHLNEAVSKRIQELMREYHLTQYALSMKSGVPQSTLSTIINCKFKGMRVRIIYEICEGLEIELKDFFDPPLFSREKVMD